MDPKKGLVLELRKKWESQGLEKMEKEEEISLKKAIQLERNRKFERKSSKVIKTKDQLKTLYQQLLNLSFSIPEEKTLLMMNEVFLSYLFQFFEVELAWKLILVCKTWMNVAMIRFGLNIDQIIQYLYTIQKVNLARGLLFDQKYEPNVLLRRVCELQDWDFLLQILKNMDLSSVDHFVLNEACKHGCTKIVRYLLQGKHLDLSSSISNECIQIARDQNHEEICKILESRSDSPKSESAEEDSDSFSPIERRSPIQLLDSIELTKKKSPNPRIHIGDQKSLQFSHIRQQLEDSVSFNWIDISELEVERQLSSGSSSKVFKGFYRGNEVAIKVLEHSEKQLESFKHEFKILSSVKGPKVVSFFGACLEPRLSLVMEFCEMGSLYDVLSDESYEFKWETFFNLAIQMVKAIQTLHFHKPQILHRDIKSMNFLVDENWCIKVCDFGLARFKKTSLMSTLEKLRGTILYCAPETCRGEKYTFKSDIYSMSICFWEMVIRCMTGHYEIPYSEYQDIVNGVQVLIQVPEGLRPSLPNDCPSLIREIIEICWDNLPDKRPDSTQLMQKFVESKQEYNKNPNKWLDETNTKIPRRRPQSAPLSPVKIDSHEKSESSSTEPRRSSSFMPYTSPIKLKVICPDKGGFTHTSIADASWKVSKVISKIQKRVPGETSSYTLFLFIASRYVEMLSDKTLQEYENFIQDNELEVYFKPKHIKKHRKQRSWISMLTGRKKNNKSLFEAIEKQDYQQLEHLLSISEEEKLKELDPNGRTLLHSSVISNNLKMVQAVLGIYELANLDVNVKDLEGKTPLHYACEKASETEGKILIRLLNSPQISFSHSTNNGDTPLMLFVEKWSNLLGCKEILDIFLSKAANTLNMVNNNGETVLHRAIFNPNSEICVEIVRCLLDHNVDINVQNNVEETALHYAIRNRRKEVAKMLMKFGADPSIKSYEKKSPYKLAWQLKQDDIASLFKDCYDLYIFLKELGIETIYLLLLKEDIFLDILALADKTSITEIWEKTKINDKILQRRFFEGCELLKGSFAKRKFEESIQRASHNRMSLNQPIRKVENREAVEKLKENLMEEEIFIPHSLLSFQKEIGRGSSSTIFKGFYNNQKVAIKVFDIDETTCESLKREFQLNRLIKCQYIVEMFGLCIEPRVCLVMEYCSRKSILKILKDDIHPLGWGHFFKFATGIARGLNYLHSQTPPILHRNIKSSNILVHKDWRILLGDLQLIQTEGQATLWSLGSEQRQYVFNAPELSFSNLSYSEKSDIYSFAIVLWEIANRIVEGHYKHPWPEVEKSPELDYQVFCDIVHHNRRPSSSKLPPTIEQFLQNCWDPTPTKRLSAIECLEKLQILEKAFQSD